MEDNGISLLGTKTKYYEVDLYIYLVIANLQITANEEDRITKKADLGLELI